MFVWSTEKKYIIKTTLCLQSILCSLKLQTFYNFMRRVFNTLLSLIFYAFCMIIYLYLNDVLKLFAALPIQRTSFVVYETGKEPMTGSWQPCLTSLSINITQCCTVCACAVIAHSAARQRIFALERKTTSLLLCNAAHCCAPAQSNEPFVMLSTKNSARNLKNFTTT